MALLFYKVDTVRLQCSLWPGRKRKFISLKWGSGLINGVPLFTFARISRLKECSVLCSVTWINPELQAPNPRGRRQGVPPWSVDVNLVCICLLKITKHKKTQEPSILTHAHTIHKKGKVGFPNAFPLQYWVVFYFHFSRGRKFRISHLVQNIITFWYCIYDNIL